MFSLTWQGVDLDNLQVVVDNDPDPGDLPLFGDVLPVPLGADPAPDKDAGDDSALTLRLVFRLPLRQGYP